MKDLCEYGELLKDHKISYGVYNNHLQNIKTDFQPKWTIFLSAKTLDTPALLKLILLKIKYEKISFKIIKNQILQYQLNGGMLGENEIGKVISLYPKSITDAIQLAKDLNAISNTFKGPTIPNALRIGEIVYAESATISPIAYQISKQYLNPKKHPVRIGKYYVPIETIKTSYKGDIYKAVTLKGFSFKTCIIKQGKSAALDDQYQREMKHRLLWQKTVILDLQHDVMTPAYIDYFEDREHSYLVMEYAAGITLFQTVTEIYQEKQWETISTAQRKTLLLWYLDAVNIVDTIHQKGYVQRDISDSNFLILTDGQLCIIDFELSYSMTRNEPEHPFLLGTYGYVAPEQLRYATPDYTEDIYSLGALLCFMLTGLSPVKFIETTPQHTRNKIHGITRSSALTKMIMDCLSLHRNRRPEIQTIKETLTQYISELESKE